MTEKRFIQGGDSYSSRYLHSDEKFRKETNWNINLPIEREFKCGECIVTDKDDTAYHIDELVTLLNELHDENEQLKQQIGNLEHTRDFCADVCADCKRLEEENEQLKANYNSLSHNNGLLYDECSNKINALKKENEQLKKRNDKQCTQLKQLWELIEDEDYNTLRSMLNQRETDEKLLQKEWRTYSD